MRRRVQGTTLRPSQFGSDRKQDDTLVRATIHGSTTLASTAAGIINGSFSMDPSTATGTDWADYSSTYDEFRVLGCRITFISNQPNTLTSLVDYVAVAFDNDSTGNPGSLSAVRQYSTSRIFPAIWNNDKMYSFTWWRPVRGLETNIPWIDVATPSSSPGSIPIYAGGNGGLTVSTVYFTYAIEYFCQFRGRR